MNTRQRYFLDNFNRILIFALTLMALLMDGFQHADVPAVLALLIWLWLTVCTRIEATLLGLVRRGQVKLRSTKHSRHSRPWAVHAARATALRRKL